MTRPQQARLLRGFYAVLDRPSEELAAALVGAGGAGGCALQVRLKPEGGVSTADLMATARMAKQVASSAGALLVVNDRVDVALAVEADAVHLGQEDLSLQDARRVVVGAGSNLLIGISTHDADQVRAAVTGGADYLGFGPVFGTSTKRNPDPVRGLAMLAEAVKLAGEVPVVAIGGIEPSHAESIAATGAAAACAIASVNGAGELAAVIAAGRAIAKHWPS